jgi:hypothetical protein
VSDSGERPLLLNRSSETPNEWRGGAESGVHRPASANVGSGTTQVFQQVGVAATSLFQGIRKDGEAGRFEFARRKRTLFIGSGGEGGHGRGQPAGIHTDAAEGVADEVAQQAALRLPLSPLSGEPVSHPLGMLWIATRIGTKSGTGPGGFDGGNIGLYSGGFPHWRMRRQIRGGFQSFSIDKPVSELLDQEEGFAGTLLGEQIQDTAATCTGKQAQLPVAGLAS